MTDGVLIRHAHASQYDLYVNLRTPEYIERYSLSKSINDFLAELGEGDLIFSRSDTIIGKIIQRSAHSIWSHVGLCVIDPATGMKCYWESANGTDSSDMPGGCAPLYGGAASGVRMWPIKNRLEHMLRPDVNGNPRTILFAVSKLSLQYPINLLTYTSRLHEFARMKTGIPYQYNYSVIFFAWFDGLPSIKRYFCSSRPAENDIDEMTDHDIIDDRKSLFTSNKSSGQKNAYFCSELVTDTLMYMGLMNSEECPPCSEWTVDDLFHVSNINKFIHCGVFYKQPVMYIVNKQ